MFANYIIKKSEFSIHFENGFFVVITIPQNTNERKSFMEELSELFTGEISDIVTVSLYDNTGKLLEKKEQVEPIGLLKFLIKNASALN